MQIGMEIIGLSGNVRFIVIPDHIPIEDATDLGKALVMWNYELNKKEVETLQRLASGLTIEKIAEELDVSTKTIENRQEKIYEKLRIRSRQEAAAIATAYGFGSMIDKLKKA